METVMTILGWLVLLTVVVVVLLAAVRFFALRSNGTQILLRTVPAKDTHNWRHGLLRYRGELMEFYKLRSVWPAADLTLNRLDIEFLGSRTLDDDEASFMTEATEAVHFQAAGQEYELATDLHGAMALNAWVESAPSKRLERVDIKKLRERVQRDKRQQGR
ncbi:DUF2550 domain-containing protein [Corynebacterium sp. SA-MJD20WY100]|uniref:DUF2550 domain-containing protein n=1 Tax=Corynebacterium sp. SA-MJD20WY100 TaxID=3142969 RepID=UPI003221CD57